MPSPATPVVRATPSTERSTLIGSVRPAVGRERAPARHADRLAPDGGRGRLRLDDLELDGDGERGRGRVAAVVGRRAGHGRVPTGNGLPLAGRQPTVGLASTTSVAVGAVKLTAVPAGIGRRGGDVGVGRDGRVGRVDDGDGPAVRVRESTGVLDRAVDQGRARAEGRCRRSGDRSASDRDRPGRPWRSRRGTRRSSHRPCRPPRCWSDGPVRTGGVLVATSRRMTMLGVTPTAAASLVPAGA